MNKKSGKAGTLVPPVDPDPAHAADKADPGEVAQVKAQQRQTKQGKYGKTLVDQQNPDAGGESGGGEGTGAGDDPTTKTHWIAFSLTSAEDGKPIPGEKYLVTLPDGTQRTGTLDDQGQARVDGIPAGNCKISFPDRDKDAWKPA